VASATTILSSFFSLALFATTFLVFTSPGWGLAQFYGGRDLDPVSRTALALFFGLLAGSLIYCAMRLSGFSDPIVALSACLVAGVGLGVFSSDTGDGVVRLARMGPADYAAIGALLLLVTLVVGPVFANVGRSVDGYLHYRAYFNADLFAHMSVVGELEKGTTPTVNPYLSGEPLPYYWTYFTFPTVFAMLQPHLGVDRGILLTDVVAAAVFIVIWFLVVRSIGGSTLASAAAWVTVIVATSFEGIALIAVNWRNQTSWWAFRDFNVDGVTRWLWDLPAVDGLHRLFWYTPQHGTAITAGLLVFATFVLARNRNALRRGAFDGLLLGGALACSSFNGLVLIAWYAISETITLARNHGRELRRWLVSRALAATMVLGTLGLLVALGMIQRSSNVAVLRWNEHFAHAPGLFLLVTFGAAPVLAAIGWRRLRRTHPDAMMASLVLTVICAFLLLAVDLRGHENSYVPFRVGHLMYLVLAVWLAFAIDTWRTWRRPMATAMWVVLVLLGVLATPTVALDWYNTRDIANLTMNPGGFPWTVRISRDEQAALEWIRASVPSAARVQTEGIARGRGTWALIPAFARRRMATGLAIFQPDPERFDANLVRIRTVFRSRDIDKAYAYCERMGIDFLYVGREERAAHDPNTLKFDRHPEKFERVYQNGEVSIYWVVRRKAR
jgi:hypothetical protein